MTEVAASEAESIDTIATAGAPDVRQAAGFVRRLTQQGHIHAMLLDWLARQAS